MTTRETQTKKPEPKPPAGLPEEFTKLDDDFGDVWDPKEVGETLNGVFLGVAYVPSPRGSFVTHRIKTTQGVRSVASAILERRMERIPNDTPIYLQYTGMTKTRQGESKAFDVFYPKRTQLKAPKKPPEISDEYTRG